MPECHTIEQDKLAAIRNAPDDMKEKFRSALSDGERQKLWKQFEYSRKTRMPKQAGAAWDSVANMPARAGKVQAKNEMLWSWIVAERTDRDPTRQSELLQARHGPSQTICTLPVPVLS